MVSFGALYYRLSEELNLVATSKKDVPCNLMSFAPALQAVLSDLFLIGNKDNTSELAKLSILKLFLELVLTVPQSEAQKAVFKQIFSSDFLNSLIDKYRGRQECHVYLISDVSALFVFTAHKLKLTKYVNLISDDYSDIVTYLDEKKLPIKAKLHLVNSLCKFQKKYGDVSFADIICQVFSMIWSPSMISSIEHEQMFYVKVCLDALATDAGNHIRSLVIKHCEFFLEFFCTVNNVTLKNYVCMFLSELLPSPGDASSDESLTTHVAGSILACLRRSEFCLLQDGHVPTACITVLKISLRILNDNSQPLEKETLSSIFMAVTHFELSADEWISLCIEEDKDLIDFLSLHLDLAWLVHKKEISNASSCSLLQIKPSELYLELMLKLSFNVSVLNDWLISNETQFLLYLIKLCKMLRLFWSEFKQVCHLMNSTQRVEQRLCLLGTASLFDACMSAFIRLKINIMRLHRAKLYPYSPEPLIKLLSRLEALYENGDLNT